MMEDTRLKKPLIYLSALMLLSMSIALIQNTNLGMAPWDALARNFYEGVPMSYTFISPLLSIVLISMAYMIRWKKPDVQMVIPVLISSLIGVFIDVALIFIPNVSDLHYFWNYFYLFFAMFLISVGLNVIIYCGYTLPALEQFILALSWRLKMTFGRAKLMGEAIAFSLTIIFGFVFHHQSEYFYIGQTTIIVLLFIGFLVDAMKKPMQFILRRII
jgi:uncharacterized membrane protein YczE